MCVRARLGLRRRLCLSRARMGAGAYTCPLLTSQILQVRSIEPVIHLPPSQSNWQLEISPRCPCRAKSIRERERKREKGGGGGESECAWKVWMQRPDLTSHSLVV